MVNAHQRSCNCNSLLLPSRQLSSSLPHQRRGKYKSELFEHINHISFKYEPVCQNALAISWWSQRHLPLWPPLLLHLESPDFNKEIVKETKVSLICYDSFQRKIWLTINVSIHKKRDIFFQGDWWRVGERIYVCVCEKNKHGNTKPT